MLKYLTRRDRRPGVLPVQGRRSRGHRSRTSPANCGISTTSRTGPSRSSPTACSTRSTFASKGGRIWWSTPAAAITRRGSSSSDVIRPARPDDLPAIAAIQRSSPEAAAWDPSGYDVLVAELDNRGGGIPRHPRIAEGEREVLNLAVAPEYRRRGIARSLLRVSTLRDRLPGGSRIESAARSHSYKSLGFQELS